MPIPVRLLPALLLLPLLPLLGACASVASAPAMSAESAGAYDGLVEVWGDQERLEFSKRMQVTLPARVAVADVSAASYPREDDERVRDRRAVCLVDALVQDTESFSDVFNLFRSGRGSDTPMDMDRLRAAASRSQVDLLLLVDRRERVDEHLNLLAPLNVLLLPMLFLPTQQDDLEMSIRMALVDVRNGLLYTTVDELRRTDFTATAAGEDDRVDEEMDALFTTAVESLRERLGRKLRDLRDLSGRE
jgi:hypothetical protein